MYNMENLLLLIIESLELAVITSLVHIMMKNIFIAKCHILTKLCPKGLGCWTVSFVLHICLLYLETRQSYCIAVMCLDSLA